jgi:hypothetical protein
VLNRASGWIALLAVLVGTGCSTGPVKFEDPTAGIVVSGGYTVFFPKSPPSGCVLSDNRSLIYGTNLQGGSAPTFPELTFNVSPYTGVDQRYKVGSGRATNYSELRLSQDDGWHSSGGSVTIVSVTGGVVSGTLQIPDWNYAGLQSPRAIAMVGAWSCKFVHL